MKRSLYLKQIKPNGNDINILLCILEFKYIICYFIIIKFSLNFMYIKYKLCFINF